MLLKSDSTKNTFSSHFFLSYANGFFFRGWLIYLMGFPMHSKAWSVHIQFVFLLDFIEVKKCAIILCLLFNRPLFHMLLLCMFFFLTQQAQSIYPHA
jgi:hypothetical protein